MNVVGSFDQSIVTALDLGGFGPDGAHFPGERLVTMDVSGEVFVAKFPVNRAGGSVDTDDGTSRSLRVTVYPVGRTFSRVLFAVPDDQEQFAIIDDVFSGPAIGFLATAGNAVKFRRRGGKCVARRRGNGDGSGSGEELLKLLDAGICGSARGVVGGIFLTEECVAINLGRHGQDGGQGAASRG